MVRKNPRAAAEGSGVSTGGVSGEVMTSCVQAPTRLS
jgi:hypothetical protein